MLLEDTSLLEGVLIWWETNPQRGYIKEESPECLQVRGLLLREGPGSFLKLLPPSHAQGL